MPHRPQRLTAHQLNELQIQLHGLQRSTPLILSVLAPPPRAIPPAGLQRLLWPRPLLLLQRGPLPAVRAPPLDLRALPWWRRWPLQVAVESHRLLPVRSPLHRPVAVALRRHRTRPAPAATGHSRLMLRMRAELILQRPAARERQPSPRSLQRDLAELPRRRSLRCARPPRPPRVVSELQPLELLPPLRRRGCHPTGHVQQLHLRAQQTAPPCSHQTREKLARHLGRRRWGQRAQGNQQQQWIQRIHSLPPLLLADHSHSPSLFASIAYSVSLSVWSEISRWLMYRPLILFE